MYDELMNEEEKNAIEYLKNRLYGNEGCKYIDVAQEDLKIFVNLINQIEKLQKENELAKQSLIKNSNIADERNNLLVKNQELKEVITKMAEYIASKDIDEDVCKKVGHGKYCEEYGENSNCKECVIEFFKGEVNK